MNTNLLNTNASTEQRLQTLLENISAYIEQYHGGSVTLENYDGKILTVKMGGACEGCPLTKTTLQGWVKGTVKQFFPEIEDVVEATPNA